MSKTNSISPSSSLFQFINGFHVSQALYVVTKLGIADHLINGPKNCDILADKLNLNAESLYRVLRSLSSLEIFHENANNEFALTPISQYLRSDTKNSLRNVVLLNCGEERYRAFGGLLGNVKTGLTAFNSVFGMGYYQYLSQHEDAYDILNRAMVELSHLGISNVSLINIYDFSQSKVVVDIGGGKGFLIASILKKYSNLHGILFDLPDAVADAQSVLSSFDVSDRCIITPGSAFVSIPSGGDIYILSKILHNWSDEDSIKILHNCKKTMKQDGKLIIFDLIFQDGILPSSDSQLDLNMMAVTGGKERTEKQWKTLLDKGGFLINRMWNSGTNIIEAMPKKSTVDFHRNIN